MVTGLVIAVVAALLVSACGVTRGEEASGLHRLRMMVPNSPGGGYDLTARTAVKIMEDDDITGRVEVFNVIGAGGTVAMARLMNEKGNGDQAFENRPEDPLSHGGVQLAAGGDGVDHQGS